MPEEDVLYLLSTTWSPWTVVDKGEWVIAERNAGIENTRGDKDEPQTGWFSNYGAKGAICYVRCFDPSHYSRDPELREAIVAALDARHAGK